MVLVGTYLFSSDNSGAIRVKCIKILGCSYCNHTNIGDKIVISVQKATFNKKVSKHGVYKSIIIRQKSKTLRKSGVLISFLKNSVVLVKDNNDPIGNRVTGSVLQELRFKKCLKIMLLAWNIV